ncbi:hypothetical protein C1H46_025131 [Malus baccata]|uniref:Aspartate/glutamate/uridylate kinase domain-containing protein n=1 Tax=Malus baccata TaxID=106549 RepID=A0A540LSP1_MALBA|nr:hypothetical protein C1H46_025131 [Malus baccata]
MEETNTKDLQSASVSLTKSIRCIVKLGGAAVTCKNELETINEANLKMVSSQLRQSMATGSPSGEVLGMDWSKQPGESEISSAILDFEHRPVADPCPFIVVHGAEGIPSIGMSPFSCGWSTRERNIASADLSAVAKAIESGLVPVLHGDAVLDELLDCTILSGDVIISHLAAHLKPDFVVFLTDVFGVYDRPPLEPNAVLLREIAVAKDGSWSIVSPTLENMNKQGANEPNMLRALFSLLLAVPKWELIPNLFKLLASVMFVYY